MEKYPDTRFRINIRSYFDILATIFGLKISVADPNPGSGAFLPWIRDPE
jgi:hypothetical protein